MEYQLAVKKRLSFKPFQIVILSQVQELTFLDRLSSMIVLDNKLRKSKYECMKGSLQKPVNQEAEQVIPGK